MKKRVVKMAIGAICALTVTASAFSFVACGETEENKVMTVGLNPQVEFVLDGENKVVSVNALNEEGNLIITAQAFSSVEGKSAEEAARLFVQVSKDTGFLVEGSAGQEMNELSISISGEEATALYEDVKGDIQSYLSELDVRASIGELHQITEAEIEALVAECSPYLTQAEVQAMEYAELLESLRTSRQETAELYSQELKSAYYDAKAFALQQAEVEVLKSKVNAMAQIGINALTAVYETAIETVEDIRMRMLVATDSPYQVALAAFRDAKAEYVNYRNYVAGLEQTEVTTEIAEMLANYQTVVDNTETVLVQAGETANDALDTAKTRLSEAYGAVIEAIEEAAVAANDFADEIATAKEAAIAEMDAAFESEYGQLAVRATADWMAMRTVLEAGYSPAEE